MNDPLAALIQAGALNKTLFPLPSRYHGIETKMLEKKDGQNVIFIKRRFVPHPDR